MPNHTLSEDLQEGIAVWYFYLHKNPEKIFMYKINSISDNFVLVQLYNRNGIRIPPFQEEVNGSDFRCEEGRITVNLENCLNDRRASSSFRIRRFSCRTFY